MLEKQAKMLFRSDKNLEAQLLMRYFVNKYRYWKDFSNLHTKFEARIMQHCEILHCEILQK